jgi:histidinol-phosphate/aromatic aminotransferase/cobyric acid decarboxylase-like protein
MKKMEEYYVPWMKGQKMYISSHIELAWKKPTLKRMMSNENPLPPSVKVVAAIEKYGRMANRYPDQGLAVRTKIAEINGLAGPENVMIGNGSSEIYDMLWRSLIGRATNSFNIRRASASTSCAASWWAASSCRCPWSIRMAS